MAKTSFELSSWPRCVALSYSVCLPRVDGATTASPSASRSCITRTSPSRAWARARARRCIACARGIAFILSSNILQGERHAVRVARIDIPPSSGGRNAFAVPGGVGSPTRCGGTERARVSTHGSSPYRQVQVNAPASRPYNNHAPLRSALMPSCPTASEGVRSPTWRGGRGRRQSRTDP